MPELIVIAALTESNRVIGDKGKLPWSIPEDLKRFRQLTLNHTVIMGRKTWEFDLQKRPLRTRNNVIVSSKTPISALQPIDKNGALEVCFARSLTEALDLCATHEKVFIIGGASLYAQAIDLADTLELTLIEADYEGDVFFPDYRARIGTEFELIKTESGNGYRFETYRRL